MTEAILWSAYVLLIYILKGVMNINPDNFLIF